MTFCFLQGLPGLPGIVGLPGLQGPQVQYVVTLFCHSIDSIFRVILDLVVALAKMEIKAHLELLVK